MKPNSKAPNYIVILCGIFVSFASFAINSQSESEDNILGINQHTHQPTLYSTIQMPKQIQEKRNQNYTHNKKQPPLNIVASFILIEAKTSQDHDKEALRNNTQYETLIYNFILTLF